MEEGKILTYPCSNAATLVMEDEVISQTELKPAPQRTNMIGFCEVAAGPSRSGFPLAQLQAGGSGAAGRASGGAQLPLSQPDVAASYMFTLSADYRIIARYNSGRRAARPRRRGGRGGRGRDVCGSGSHWGVFNFTERKFFNLFVSSLMIHSDRVKN